MHLDEHPLENGTTTRIDQRRVVRHGFCDGLDAHGRNRDHERFNRHAREHEWRSLNHRYPHHAVAHERWQCATVVIRASIIGGVTSAVRTSAAVQHARELLTSIQKQQTNCSLYIF